MMVDHEMNELKREFLTEAEEKVREIEGSLGKAMGAESIERIGYLAHQLKGSGGSYGYAKISTEAAEIEHVVEESTEGEISDAARSGLQAHAGALRAEIEKSLRDLAEG